MLSPALARRSSRRPLRVERIEPRCLLATFAVTTDSDAGDGSLRWALQQAEASAGADLIRFEIPGDGPHVIAPKTPLPRVPDSTTIDGYTQPGARPNAATLGSDAALMIALDGRSAVSPGLASGLFIGKDSVVRGLAIGNFAGTGIVIFGEHNRIEGNFIGADPTGKVARGNRTGIVLDRADSNLIGGPTPSARNIISGNLGHGIELTGYQTDRFTSEFAELNRIQGNLIGTDATAQGALGNGGSGIDGTIFFSFVSNTIGGENPGEGNTIAFNRGSGIYLDGVISGNSIHSNGGLGISHRIGGPDRLIPFVLTCPLLTSVEVLGPSVRIRGVVPHETFGSSRAPCRLEFFADAGDSSGMGEGQIYLGAAQVTPVTDEATPFDVTLPVVPPEGSVITATATVRGRATTEFSPTSAAVLADLEVELTSPTGYVVTGHEFEVTATVKNRGPNPATNINLQVDLNPAAWGDSIQSISILEINSSLGQGAETSRQLITWRIDALDVGEAGSVTIRALYHPTARPDYFPYGGVTIRCKATSDQLDIAGPVYVENRMRIDPYDLKLDLDAPSILKVGQRATLHATITNLGPSAAPNPALRGYGVDFDYGGFRIISVTRDGKNLEEYRASDPEYILGRMEPGEVAEVDMLIEAGQAGRHSLGLRAEDLGPDDDLIDQNSNQAVTIVVEGPPPVVDPPPPVVEGPPPVVTGLTTVAPAGLRPRAFLLTFDGDIDPRSAMEVPRYAVTDAGPDGRFGTRDDRSVPLEMAEYDNVTRSVRLVPRGRLARNRSYRVTIDVGASGGLLDGSGRTLDGDGDGQAGGDFSGSVAVGRRLCYRDADGDRVTLALRGGLLELWRDQAGDARVLHLLPRHRRNVRSAGSIPGIAAATAGRPSRRSSAPIRRPASACRPRSPDRLEPGLTRADRAMRGAMRGQGAMRGHARIRRQCGERQCG